MTVVRGLLRPWQSHLRDYRIYGSRVSAELPLSLWPRLLSKVRGVSGLPLSLRSFELRSPGKRYCAGHSFEVLRLIYLPLNRSPDRSGTCDHFRTPLLRPLLGQPTSQRTPRRRRIRVIRW